MIIVSVLINRSQTFGSSFTTKKEADVWIEAQEAKGHWGEDYEIVIEDLDDVEINRATKIRDLKQKRDHILCATDWLFLPDVKVDQKHRRIYIEYRQLLRDFPQNLRPKSAVSFEEFEHWLRRKYPEEFMDGGKSQKIIEKFKHYIKE